MAFGPPRAAAVRRPRHGAARTARELPRQQQRFERAAPVEDHAVGVDGNAASPRPEASRRPHRRARTAALVADDRQALLGFASARACRPAPGSPASPARRSGRPSLRGIAEQVRVDDGREIDGGRRRRDVGHGRAGRRRLRQPRARHSEVQASWAAMAMARTTVTIEGAAAARPPVRRRLPGGAMARRFGRLAASGLVREYGAVQRRDMIRVAGAGPQGE